jgi:hypothetical protein
MPAKRIIILEQQDAQTYRYAMWADVPAARQPFFANASAKSAWSGALTADNTALQNGSVAEQVATFQVPAGEALATTLARLTSLWNNYQNGITNNNLWVRYGSFWDGTTWTNAGVA